MNASEFAKYIVDKHGKRTPEFIVDAFFIEMPERWRNKSGTLIDDEKIKKTTFSIISELKKNGIGTEIFYSEIKIHFLKHPESTGYLLLF